MRASLHIGSPLTLRWLLSETQTPIIRRHPRHLRQTGPKAAWRHLEAIIQGWPLLEFTGAWPGHPAVTATESGVDMVAAFKADSRRQPLHQYHSCNLLWARHGVDSATHPGTAGTEHGIPLCAEDREALMGYTTHYIAALEKAMKAACEEAMQDSPLTEDKVHTMRNNCIGQGWHLPSVIALLVIALAQILPVGSSDAPPLLTWQQEQWMQPRSMQPQQCTSATHHLFPNS